MRNAIREYIHYSDEEKRDLWEHATFVFDTNVFLNLYRYTDKTRKLLLSAFDELKDRLWMPNHVAYEFMKNRNKTIWETNHQYDTLHTKAEGFIKECRDALYLDENDQGLNELRKTMNLWIDNEKKNNVVVSHSYSDSILDQLLITFEGKVGPSFNCEELEKIEKEGEKRYDSEIPPGYKDKKKQKEENPNNVYGDYIVWKQILNYASSEKKDIILVTNDKKEDWWEILKGEAIGPRVELKKEFIDITSQRFHMYSMSSFITRFESGNDVKVDRETIDEIEFFSKVIHHKSDRKDLKDYYKSFSNTEEEKAARMRFAIMRLENKNRKRMNNIEAAREKYLSYEMPESIEEMIEHTIANYEKDSARINKLRTKLQSDHI